jgi:lysophospholipase L1-like esterase
MIRGALIFAVTLEGLLFVADALFANRPDVSLLGGPYREMRTAGRARIILGKPNEHSSFGFRTDHPYELTTDGPRVLFLGDSYTEGSGSSKECNYPDVAERVLGTRLGRDVEVMNAGVSGYGPKEALTLFRELKRMGYDFDAVVYNVFVENDFTDNLPGTKRQVIAGISFRFPESTFLRTFHPFNTRLVRWALFASALIRFERSADAPEPPGIGPCDLAARPLGEVSPFLEGTVKKGLSCVRRATTSRRAMEETARTITAMQREADGVGVPFVVVIFPDRVLADRELRERLDLDADRLAPSRALRAFLRDELRGMTVFDTTDLLSDRIGMYRLNDTHLSDAGNVLVGEWVGERLSSLLR